MKSQEKKSAPVSTEAEQKASFALGKANIKLIAISFAVIVIGFLLMLGPGTTPEAYNPDIFSFRRPPVLPLWGLYLWSMQSCTTPKRDNKSV